MKRKMKRILSSVAVVAIISFVIIITFAEIAYPMHFGEPSWYHVARVDCLAGATVCALVAIISSTLASA